jgi:hypothetical protein
MNDGSAKEVVMADRRDLLPVLAHPKVAKKGDFVFVWGDDGPLSIDIVQVRAVTADDNLRLEGRKRAYPRCDILPPTKHRKAKYLEWLAISAAPVVGSFKPSTPPPPVLQAASSSPHVVGRPELVISEVEVSRSPSNYVDVRFSIKNIGHATVTIDGYQWNGKRQRRGEERPYAESGDVHFLVFQVESNGQVYPGHVSHHRVSISSDVGAGPMRLYMPSAILGGAIGTYTVLVVSVPWPTPGVN